MHYREDRRFCLVFRKMILVGAGFILLMWHMPQYISGLEESKEQQPWRVHVLRLQAAKASPCCCFQSLFLHENLSLEQALCSLLSISLQCREPSSAASSSVPPSDAPAVEMREPREVKPRSAMEMNDMASSVSSTPRQDGKQHLAHPASELSACLYSLSDMSSGLFL